MSAAATTIPSQPVLSPAADFQGLRREGIGYIEQMSSATWTDYNAHDPGITILEQLCYVLTELAYRNSWDIKDLLMSSQPATGTTQPYPQQAFFTARQILSVNPLTTDDYRRLLIGLGLVRNAWVLGKECACDLPFYASCELNQPKLSFASPEMADIPSTRAVHVRGLYDVLLELEADPESGDLNDAKVELTTTVRGADVKPHTLALELRFPQWGLAQSADWQVFLSPVPMVAVRLMSLGATRIYDVMSDPGLDAEGRDQYVRQHWNGVLFLGFEVELASTVKVLITGVALHLFADNATRAITTLPALRDRLQQVGSGGALDRYRAKMRKAGTALAAAWETLAAHRNLDEDFCRIKTVRVEDVAVCADIEVMPNADIERVQAQAWFLIERYFNPPVQHYSVQEMLDCGVPVEDIFNGPAPEGGFIKAEELAASGLKTVLRTSDIIGLLMDIDGVLAVSSLLLSKYDQDGELFKGAADPTLGNGSPVYDRTKGSAAWQLAISAQHQPRLYIARSRFLFKKNGLPFLARRDEAADILLQLQGEAERGQVKSELMDLPVPSGTYRQPSAYAPMQLGLPQTYGIGTSGLPPNSTPLRKSQAKQLQAYLLVFEQLLANAGAQIAHMADLFSIDPSLSRTYFSQGLTTEVLACYGELVQGLTNTQLSAMTESPIEFTERRNRFLDHLLARFGESFGDYALLMTDANGRQAGMARLIDDKIGFLANYPRISADRARAIDWAHRPRDPDNVAVVAQRMRLLLGCPDLHFVWTGSATTSIAGYALHDGTGRRWLEGTFPAPYVGADIHAAQQLAYDAAVERLSQPQAYHLVQTAGQFFLKVRDANEQPMGVSVTPLTTADSGRALRDELLAWSTQQRAIVVEHLLLRPKFPGDGLIAPCAGDSCTTCDGVDPYSFRLSFVMPGWAAPFADNLTLRSFAERTVQQELPSHLVAKLCWVGNDGYEVNPCDPVMVEVAGLLEAEGLTVDGHRPDGSTACACARALYAQFSAVFNGWYADKSLDYLHADALDAALIALFTTQPMPGDVVCSVVLEEVIVDKIRTAMTAHFHAIVHGGWQFERFERAWRSWLDANAAFNWAHEHLKERVEAILQARLGTVADRSTADRLCRCASAITTARGLDFDAWMVANMAAGRKPIEFSVFTPAPVQLDAALTFKVDTAALVEALLNDRYAAYVEVSYRLRIVLALLANLRNVYPGATLHDCDDGSDLNPVRLGSTALGQQPRRSVMPTLDVEIEPEPAIERDIEPALASGRPVTKARMKRSQRKPKPT